MSNLFEEDSESVESAPTLRRSECYKCQGTGFRLKEVSGILSVISVSRADASGKMTKYPVTCDCTVSVDY